MTNVVWDGASETFKALLKSYRVRAELTQEELADGSGISVRAISDMERGIAKSPQRRTIESLAPPLALTDEELTHLQKVAKQARTRPIVNALPARSGFYEPPLRGTLPPDLDDLTGRERDVDTLRALANEPTSPSRRTGRCAVLSGPPGTGKTSLAVRAAHDLAKEFPDGQLFLKLRGLSPDPNEPAEVLHLLLRSLGIDAANIPVELDHRISLCRSLLEDRATLIVLDDAADEAQVRPLLVGGLRCLTLITSRQMLVGIEGASRLHLTVLEPDDAVALLSTIIGPARVSQERVAASELVELCGRLPLAVRIAGNRLASRPLWPLTHLVGQLRDQGRRLTTLSAGDLDVRSVFELSYRQLTPTATTVFRRLSLVPTADFSAGAAMALIDAPEEDDAAILLEELADASLLQTSQQEGRYQFHDLLRVFATEQLVQEEAPNAVIAAENRLIQWLVRTATAAGRYFHPTDGVSAPPLPTPSFGDHAGAGRWLEAEAQNWLAAAKKAAARGEHQQILDLAKAMHWYSELGGSASTWELLDLAVKSAVAMGSKRDEAVHRSYLAWVHNSMLGSQSHDAVQLAQQAWESGLAAGDLCDQAWACIYLAFAQRNAGDLKAFCEQLDEAVRLFDEADYQLGVHLARFMRAVYSHETGRLDDAADEFDICIHYFKQPYGGPRNPSDDINYANLLLRSAQNLAELNSLDRALSQCEEALELFQCHGATMGSARALQACGRFLYQLGEHLHAHGRLAEALALFARAGLPQSQAETLCDMAALSEELGDLVAARGERERALSLCDKVDRSETRTLRRKLSKHLNASPELPPK